MQGMGSDSLFIGKLILVELRKIAIIYDLVHIAHFSREYKALIVVQLIDHVLVERNFMLE